VKGGEEHIKPPGMIPRSDGHAIISVGFRSFLRLSNSQKYFMTKRLIRVFDGSGAVIHSTAAASISRILVAALGTGILCR